MMTALDVHFCDLCNESVPLADLDSGRAFRIKDRVVGACCAGVLRAAPAQPVAGAPDGAAAAAQPAHLIGPLLAVTGVLLAAVAGGVAFLDWRLSEETAVAEGAVRAQAETLRQLGRSLSVVEAGLEGAATAETVASVRAQVDALAERGAELRHEAGLQAARLGTLHEEVKRVGGELGRFDQSVRTRIDEVAAAVQSLAADVAALRAAPKDSGERAVAIDPASPPEPTPMPAAASDLPAELQHHVAALADPDPGTRYLAVDKLVASRNPAVCEHLIPMTRDTHPIVRRLVVAGLRDFRNAGVVDALLVSLADPESLVRHAALESLRTLTSQRIDFDPDGTESARLQGQRRWQDWWTRNRDTY